jgi:peptidyl-prolyl cis-trans isomerase SurA
MKSKVCLAVCFLFLFNQFIFSQNNNDDILLTIDNRNITKGEFERIYKKNNTKENNDNKSIENYLDLFINFKLKVIEAENMKLDTSASFLKELAGYKKQLSNPYFVDKDVDETLLKEAFERKKWDLKASHILVLLDEKATPEDTLAAYNKIMKIRKRLENGEQFDKIAKDVSDDPSAKNNGGDLGYFTVFQMVYAFESAAYGLTPGELSMPVRTRFGYHIIKVTDKRKAMGEIKVAHIMKSFSRNAKQKEMDSLKIVIDTVYAKLKRGEDFTKLVQEYSDDKNSSKKGGELNWFSTGKMIPEFENAAFSLKNNGDYTEPVKTQYGWHIIKRLEYKDVGNIEDVKSDIKNSISKDERAKRSRQAVLARIKKENNFKENIESLNEFNKVVDTSAFRGAWDIKKAENMNKFLFSIGDSSLTQKYFAEFVYSNKKKIKPVPIQDYVNDLYKKYVEETVMKYEENRLGNKYPEYRYLTSEYHDGILLFDLTDQMVWSKAVKDTTGLKEYYENNKSNYMWPERAEASIYYCKSEKIKNSVNELLKKRAKKGYTNDDILKKINKDSVEYLRIETNKFVKGDNKIVDYYAWKSGNIDEINKEISDPYLIEFKIIPPEVKTLTEAKGLVTADYQSFLENKWIKDLRNKYKVVVNQQVFSTLNK